MFITLLSFVYFSTVFSEASIAPHSINNVLPFHSLFQAQRFNNFAVLHIFCEVLHQFISRSLETFTSGNHETWDLTLIQDVCQCCICEVGLALIFQNIKIKHQSCYICGLQTVIEVWQNIIFEVRRNAYPLKPAKNLI